MVWRARGTVVSWANRTVGVPFCPAPLCPAALPCAAPPRPARSMFGFWTRQVIGLIHCIDMLAPGAKNLLLQAAKQLAHPVAPLLFISIRTILVIHVMIIIIITSMVEFQFEAAASWQLLVIQKAVVCFRKQVPVCSEARYAPNFRRVLQHKRCHRPHLPSFIVCHWLHSACKSFSSR